MKSSRAAIRYAKALVQESIDKKCLEQVYLDMQIISNTFNQNDDLKFLVESRVVKNSLKLSTLKLIFKNITKLSLKFIDVLSENNRIDLTETVAFKFIGLYKDHKGIQSAVVTTAVPLNDKMEQEVLEAVSKLTNKKTILENKIDKTLIGGFILRVGDVEYNASFKNKLKNIKQVFTKNTNLSIS
jgi:F-type H+-transporting ATPase subunit delta